MPKADIAAQGYDLSLNRYKEVVHEAVEHRAPKEILADLAKLEEEIQRGMKELEGCSVEQGPNPRRRGLVLAGTHFFPASEKKGVPVLRAQKEGGGWEKFNERYLKSFVD